MIFMEPEDPKVESDEDVESLVAVQKTIISEVNGLSTNENDKARLVVLLDSLVRIAQIIHARRQYGNIVDVLSALRNCKVNDEVDKELASVADLVKLKRSRSEAA